MSTTTEEMNRAAVAARDGGDPERAALAEMMRGYVVAMMRRNAWAEMPREAGDELLAAIWLGVWKALPNFDPARGVRFSTFANFAMHEEAMTWMRTNCAQPMSARQWKRRGALVREALEVHGERWEHLSDGQLAALEVPSLDTPGASTTVPDARRLLAAGAPDFKGSDAIDADLGETAASAEDDYFSGPAEDADADALDTLAAVVAALDRGAPTEEVRRLAFDFVDRHDLGDELARRLLKTAERLA